MNLYRVQLQLRSGLGTPLASETLWGHVAWGYRYRHGEQALSDWLARYDNGETPLVISDPLPTGFVPRPQLPPEPKPAMRPSTEQANLSKRLGKVQWISHDGWMNCAHDLSPATVQHAILQEKAPPEPVTEAVAHAGINRLTGGTAAEGGGLLYSTEQTYYLDNGRVFDVWAASPESLDTVREWFEDGVIGGYGRDGATGQGHFVINDVVPAQLPEVNEPNALVLLGSFVPKPSDPAPGFVNFGVHCGRLGGDFAIGPTPDGNVQRQKHPVCCLRRGTVLLSTDPPQIVGRVLSGVHPYSEIRHCGMTLAIGCRLDSSTLSEAGQ